MKCLSIAIIVSTMNILVSSNSMQTFESTLDSSNVFEAKVFDIYKILNLGNRSSIKNDTDRDEAQLLRHKCKILTFICSESI